MSPFDHTIVAEIQKKLQRAGRSLADERGQEPPSILAGIFSGQANKNRGFVPPYDPRSKCVPETGLCRADHARSCVHAPFAWAFSLVPKHLPGACLRRFYGLVSSGARNSGRIDTGVRNPVLQHLDQELADNPYRSGRKKGLPGISPKCVGDGGWAQRCKRCSIVFAVWAQIAASDCV